MEDDKTMYKCPVCEATVGKDEAKCPECGAEFIDDAAQVSDVKYGGLSITKNMGSFGGVSVGILEDGSTVISDGDSFIRMVGDKWVSKLADSLSKAAKEMSKSNTK